jgi:hypothetical protein
MKEKVKVYEKLITDIKIMQWPSYFCKLRIFERVCITSIRQKWRCTEIFQPKPIYDNYTPGVNVKILEFFCWKKWRKVAIYAEKNNQLIGFQ